MTNRVKGSKLCCKQMMERGSCCKEKEVCNNDRVALVCGAANDIHRHRVLVVSDAYIITKDDVCALSLKKGRYVKMMVHQFVTTLPSKEADAT
jgi:hypothetical protein